MRYGVDTPAFPVLTLHIAKIANPHVINPKMMEMIFIFISKFLYKILNTILIS